MNELEHKLNRVRKLLTERQLDVLVLNRVSSFAWATCGAASYINTAASDGVGTLLITQDSRYLKMCIRDRPSASFTDLAVRARLIDTWCS